MATRADLVRWVEEAIQANNGHATIVEVAKAIWARHSDELEQSGDLFFTWQYDMRWAAQKLRHLGRLEAADHVPRGMWVLSDKDHS